METTYSLLFYLKKEKGYTSGAITIYARITVDGDQKDEPETHFNPKWRRLFISKMKELTKGRNQDLFITSHSPFIVSDSKQESVYIFKRITKDKIEIDYPKQETFGSSFNHILKMAFEMDETISEEGNNFIENLLKSTDTNEIEEGLKSIGESPKLLSVYRRLEMLKKP